jgi:cytochrome P450
MLARLFDAINGRARARFAGVPGPPPGFPLGTAGDFLRPWPWERCAHYARRYGGLTLIWLFNRPALVLNDPDPIGEVLDTRAADFYKDAPVRALKPVITPGSLFVTNFGRGWEEARRANPLGPSGYGDWLDRQVQPLRAAVAARVREWVGRPPARPVDLYWEMQRLTFDAFAQAFWGRTFPPDRFDWFRTLAATGTRRMAAPMPLLPPLSPFFYPARRNWYRSFGALVAEARRRPNPDAPDLLNVTLCRGTPLADAALAEALATNFFGGVFSCSSTVNTALYLLAAHPPEGAKVAGAVRALPAAYDRAALDACRPLEFAAREAMRYYPAVPIYFRNSAPDREVPLGPLTLPRNTPLFISNWYLHKYAPHWRAPEAFDPGRWDGGGAEANPYGSGHFFPFGRGPRACVGAAFGQLVHRLVLATVYRESEPAVDAARPYRQSFFFGVMMPKGLAATFRPPG